MTTFSLTQETQTEAPSFSLVDTFEVQPSNYSTERDTIIYSAITGQTYADVETRMRGFEEGRLYREAQGATQQARQEEVGIALESDEAGELINQQIESMREIDLFGRFLPPSLSAAVSANITGAREMALDLLSKLVYAGEAIQDTLSGQTMGEAVFNVGELLVDPLSSVHVATYRNLTSRFEELLAPGTSYEDFEEGFQEILDDAEDAGFLSNENRFYFADFLSVMASGVYSREADFMSVLGWLDLGLTAGAEGAALGGATLRGATALATGGVLAGGLVLRGAGRGALDAARDSLASLSLIRPSARRDAAVDQALRRALIDEQTATILPAHTHYSALTPSGVRGSFLSAPSHTTIRNFEFENEHLRDLLIASERTGSPIDRETFETLRSEFRLDRARFLQDREGGGRVLDVELGVDRLNNIVALDILGTNQGRAFRSEAAARRLAGDAHDVLRLDDGGWVVIRRENVSPTDLSFLTDLGYRGDINGLMLFRSTNPDNLGFGIFAKWGSPNPQADSRTGSYLFSGESQFHRVLQNVERRLSEVSRRMTTRQAMEAHSAFDELITRNRQEGFTEDQFREWFFGRFEREPTNAQVNYYLLRQSELDAQLMINADIIYKRAVERRARVIDIDGNEFVVGHPERSNIPLRNGGTGTETRVYDVDSGQVRRLSEIAEDRPIYRNLDDTELPGDVQYVTGMNLEGRSVRHSDFLQRNSGGHRGYVVDEMQFLAVQRNTRTYADNSVREGAPKTLFGARTREELDSGIREINTILDELHQAMPVGPRMLAGEYADALRGLLSNPRINRIINENNAWRPDIDSLDSLLTFFKDRGLDLRTRFEGKAEGASLSEVTDPNAFDSLFVPSNTATLGDVSAMSLTRGGRGTQALPKYGGGNIGTRNNAEVMHGSYASTVNTVTQTPYLMQAGWGLVRGAHDSGVLKANVESFKNLPIRTILERIKREGLIDTTGAKGADATTGRRFQLDLERILARLNQRSAINEVWDITVKRNFANYLYGKGINPATVDRFSGNPYLALRGLAFDRSLGFFNPVQILMQGIQAVNIMGIAGAAGMKGTGLAPLVTMLINNGHDTVIKRAGQLVSKVSGLDPEDFEDLVRTYRESGRWIVENNFAEMSPVEDVASQVGVFSNNPVTRSVARGFSRFRDRGRMFFRAGERFARSSAFSTAYIEALEKFGRRNSRNSGDFLEYITAREQTLTQNMTSASRQPYEQLPFMQFMTYNLRVMESLFAGTFSNSKSVLSTEEKIRLATTHAAVFGAMASTPSALLSQWMEYNSEANLPEWAVRLAQRGLLDTALSYVTGLDTAASSRFSSSFGIYGTMEKISQGRLMEVLLGPSGNLAVDLFDLTIIESISNTLDWIETGTPEEFRWQLHDFARLTSTGNQVHNAITAYMYGEFTTRSGGYLRQTEPGNVMEATFAAFGIPTEEIDSVWEYLGNRRIRASWQEQQVRTLRELYERSNTAYRRGDIEEGQRYRGRVADFLRMLPREDRDAIQRRVGMEWRALSDQLLIDSIRDGREEASRQLEE